MDARFAWTDERVEKIRALWIDGKSAGQIAAALGVTRNTVVGKLRRIGCTGRAGRAKPEGLAAPAPVMPRAPRPRQNRHDLCLIAEKMTPRRVAAASPPVVKDVAPPLSLRVTIVDLHAAMCKWPLGEPTSEDFRYCGSPQAGGPYCAYHHKLAYEPKAIGKAKRSARGSREERSPAKPDKNQREMPFDAPEAP